MANLDTSRAIKHGFRKSPLMYAVEYYNFEIVKLLVESGTDLDIKHDKSESTVLMYATQRSKFEIVKLLVEFGADLDIQDNEGKTALMYAVKRSKFEIVKMLLVAGADSNIKDNEGKTALMYAAETSHFPTITLLIRYKSYAKIIKNFMKDILYKPDSAYVQSIIKPRFEENRKRYLVDN